MHVRGMDSANAGVEGSEVGGGGIRDLRPNNQVKILFVGEGVSRYMWKGSQEDFFATK